jgi:hypothetical protein
MDGVLVAVEGRGIAAGVLSNLYGLLCLGTWKPGAPPAPLSVLDGQLPATIGGPTWWAVGGRAPHGATGVEVRDDDRRWHRGTVRAGAWVAVLPGKQTRPELPPIRFLDRAARIQPRETGNQRPLPIDEPEQQILTRHGLPDRCPGCDARAWGKADAPSHLGQLIICRKCGHTDGAVAGWYGPGGR